MHVRVAFAESELSKAKPEVGERPPVTHSGFIVYCLVLKMFVVLREKQGGSFNRNCVFNTIRVKHTVSVESFKQPTLVKRLVLCAFGVYEYYTTQKHLL